MKEEIFQIHRYSVGYKIDKQLLLSLKDIFEQYLSLIHISEPTRH